METPKIIWTIMIFSSWAMGLIQSFVFLKEGYIRFIGYIPWAIILTCYLIVLFYEGE